VVSVTGVCQGLRWTVRTINYENLIWVA